MSIRSLRREARAEIHETFSEPAFFRVTPTGDAWTGLTVRTVTRGRDPLQDVLGAFEVQTDEPVFIFRIADAPGAEAGSLISSDFGVFRLKHAPLADRDGYARALASRLRPQDAETLTAQPPDIPEEDE